MAVNQGTVPVSIRPYPNTILAAQKDWMITQTTQADRQGPRVPQELLMKSVWTVLYEKPRRPHLTIPHQKIAVLCKNQKAIPTLTLWGETWISRCVLQPWKFERKTKNIQGGRRNIYHNIVCPPCTNQQTCFWQAAQVCQTKNKDFTKNINKICSP